MRLERVLVCRSPTFFIMNNLTKKDIDDVIRATKESAQKGNPQSQRAYLQMAGVLNDKDSKEGLVDLTPEQYIVIGRRILSEMRKDANEFGGVCPLCGKSGILPEQVHVSSEQERGQSGQMATVSLPDRPPINSANL